MLLNYNKLVDARRGRAASSCLQHSVPLEHIVERVVSVYTSGA